VEADAAIKAAEEQIAKLRADQSGGGGGGMGAVWWMERSLIEARKFMPKSRGGIARTTVTVQ
jgi:hypothetical protein